VFQFFSGCLFIATPWFVVSVGFCWCLCAGKRKNGYGGKKNVRRTTHITVGKMPSGKETNKGENRDLFFSFFFSLVVTSFFGSGWDWCDISGWSWSWCDIPGY